MKILGKTGHPQGMGPGTPGWILVESPRPARPAKAVPVIEDDDELDIDEMPIEAAKKVIQSSMSEDMLKGWIKNTGKKSLRDAATKRLKEIGG